MNTQLIFAILCFLSCNVSIEGAKIFFMIPLSSISEKQVYIPWIDSLAERGHEVVVASIIKSKYKSKNIREFVPCTYEQFVGDAFSDPIEARKHMGRYTSLALTDHTFITDACEIVYQNPEFQKVLKEKFDLVIKNSFAGHCFNGAIYRLQAPFMSLNTMIPFPEVYEQSGAKLPASFIPFAMGPSRTSGKMSFIARLENVLLDLHWSLYLKYSHYPAMENIYRKYLGQDIPSTVEILKNISLVFSNSHFVHNAPAPVLPDVIEVGGIQCVTPKPLPKDIDKFLSGAKDGVIYFSMGSMVNSQFFSKSVQKMFLSVFSKLKQRVLWKFEAELDNLPPNVKIGKWLPQYDILAHPNIRLFITHGGLLSTQEAIYNGVPLLALPIFADQDNNARFAEDKGFAITLEITELTEEILQRALDKILNDASYTQTARIVSTYFRDQPISPLEKAVYWAEYVIRHKGTRQLQSSARQLNIIEYYLLDVIAFLVSLLLAVLYLICVLVRRIIGLVKQSGSNNDNKKRV